MNTFFDELGNDVWDGAFQTADGDEVWSGTLLVTPEPDRLYVSLGLYREFIVGLGVTREIVMGVER